MMSLARLMAVVYCVAMVVPQASACKCGGVHGRTAWETAEKEAQDNAAVFVGTPERFIVEWNILSAKTGELVRSESLEDGSESMPRMRITFRVKKSYKGDLGAQVQLRTGLGGGDCGAQYETGLDYLIYAFESKSSGLWVSMCSPGGWLGSNYIATELRYLQKERPLPGDLAPLEYWTPPAVARRDKEREEYVKRYAAATGQICGRISPVAGAERNHIAFLPVAGSSPYSRYAEDVDRDGKFCSGRLGPGGYYIYFTRKSETEERKSAMYYPGVVDRAQAAIVEVGAGQVRSGLVFRAPRQATYAVRGFLSTDDKSGIGADGAFVMLLGPDGRVTYQQPIDFRGSFPLPKVKYFSFEHVLPGRYKAFASIPGNGWLTRVVEVNVTSHAKLIFLDVKRSKPKGS